MGGAVVGSRGTGATQVVGGTGAVVNHSAVSCRGCPVDGSHVWDRGCNLVSGDSRSEVLVWAVGGWCSRWVRAWWRWCGGIGEVPEYSCVGMVAQ